MTTTARRNVLFNAAAILVGVSAVAGAVRYTVLKPSAHPCDERYQSVMQFKLERDGAVVTPADLQSRLGGRDHGISHNVEILRDGSAPKPVVLKVSLPKGTGAPDATNAPAGGMDFPWEPRAFGEKAQACLAYNMQLSPDFDTGTVGILPGLSGSNPEGDERFEIHLAWAGTNDVNVAHRIVTKPAEQAASSTAGTLPEATPRRFETETATLEFPKGRWMRVNQELVLNKPDSSDGILRLWIDGKLVFERTDMRMRTEAATTLKGVVAAAHVVTGGLGAPTTTAADSTATFTPYEIYW